ncbi:universal stress protein [Pseudonocardia acaciae]|uniref:universal stress protein n=1 Tax=Pseudonocardia acaciae TaxID=551276 RepID=UPI0006868C03|nr:universal stress protein [Pseudonocardia acaciae]
MNQSHIVVGVDGSDPSLVALRYALSEATRRDARLTVVTAYDPPEYWSVAYGATMPVTSREIENSVRVRTQRILDDELAAIPSPPAVELIVTGGSASVALIDAAREADLLVVGHRGRGGVRSVVLGSVGLQCVLNAPCAVTVVRPPREQPNVDTAREPAAASRG